MKFKKLLTVSLAAGLLLSMQVKPANADMLSPGVNYVNESKSISGKAQRINRMTINMNAPYTTINMGISNPFTALSTTSSLSRLHTKEQNHVIGAINASLFTFESGLPTYLLAEGNNIVNLGAVSTNYNDFMHTPAAFGVTADNKAKVGKYDLSYSISHHGRSEQLTSLNRERNNGESILYTSSWPYETTRTNSTGLEVVVSTDSSVNTGHDFGETIQGKVTAIRPYGQFTSATIPQKGYVISAVKKEEVDKIRDLKVGDAIGLTVDVEKQWKGSKFMLATGPLLVQNGAVDLSIDLNSPRVTQRTARTAVATNADGSNAYFVTVDSGVTGSSGMTLTEFASYLKSIGAYNAINLDGGGSTTMVARKYGDILPTLVNRPSTGYERKVSSILEAVSTAPYGVGTYATASPKQAGSIPVDSTLGFKVDKVLDQYYNTLPIDQAKLKLISVSGGIGKIENNQFIAVKEGAGTVTAKYENASITIPVAVIPKVSDKPIALSALDSTSGLSAEAARGTASISTEKTIASKEGSGSVKLAYDFTSYKDGVSAAYLKWNSPYQIPNQPKRIGAWVYGDGMNHWLRGSLTDANGKEVVIDFTAEDKLDWVGWKYVEANIPTTAAAPFSLNRIYVAETKSTKKTKGSVWIDGIQALYTTAKTVQESFVPDPSVRIEKADKKFTVTFSQPMNAEFIHGKYVYVEDQYGVRQAVTVKKGATPTQLIVEAPAGGYKSGQNYQLVVTHFVPNSSNIKMVKDHITEFKIQ